MSKLGKVCSEQCKQYRSLFQKAEAVGNSSMKHIAAGTPVSLCWTNSISDRKLLFNNDGCETTVEHTVLNIFLITVLSTEYTGAYILLSISVLYMATNKGKTQETSSNSSTAINKQLGLLNKSSLNKHPLTPFIGFVEDIVLYTYRFGPTC